MLPQRCKIKGDRRSCNTPWQNERLHGGKSSIRSVPTMASGSREAFSKVLGNFTVKNVRFLSLQLYNYLRETRKIVKRSHGFLKLANQKFLFVHCFACRVAEETSQYTLDYYMKESLVAYVKLELTIIQDPEYCADFSEQSALKERVLGLLWTIYSKYMFHLTGRSCRLEVYAIILKFLHAELPSKIPGFFRDFLQKLKNLVSGTPIALPYFSSPLTIKVEPCDLPQNIFHEDPNISGFIWDELKKMQKQADDRRRIKEQAVCIEIEDDDDNDVQDICARPIPAAPPDFKPEKEPELRGSSNHSSENLEPQYETRELTNRAKAVLLQFQKMFGSEGVSMSINGNGKLVIGTTLSLDEDRRSDERWETASSTYQSLESCESLQSPSACNVPLRPQNYPQYRQCFEAVQRPEIYHRTSAELGNSRDLAMFAAAKPCEIVLPNRHEVLQSATFLNPAEEPIDLSKHGLEEPAKPQAVVLSESKTAVWDAEKDALLNGNSSCSSGSLMVDEDQLLQLDDEQSNGETGNKMPGLNILSVVLLKTNQERQEVSRDFELCLVEDEKADRISADQPSIETSDPLLVTAAEQRSCEALDAGTAENLPYNPANAGALQPVVDAAIETSCQESQDEQTVEAADERVHPVEAFDDKNCIASFSLPLVEPADEEANYQALDSTVASNEPQCTSESLAVEDPETEAVVIEDHTSASPALEPNAPPDDLKTSDPLSLVNSTEAGYDEPPNSPGCFGVKKSAELLDNHLLKDSIHLKDQQTCDVLDNSVESLTANPDAALDNSAESLTVNPDKALDSSAKNLIANPDQALDNSVESLTANPDEALDNSVESLTANPSAALDNSAESLTGNPDQASDNSAESLAANPGEALDNSADGLTANPDEALDKTVESLTANPCVALDNSAESLKANPDEALDSSVESLTANPDAALDNSAESLTANPVEALDSSVESLAANPGVALDNSDESLTANPNAALDNSDKTLTANPDEALDSSVESLTANPDAALDNSAESLTANPDEALDNSVESLAAKPGVALDNSAESLTANPDAALDNSADSLTANPAVALDNSAENLTGNPDQALDNSVESLTANPDAALDNSVENLTANPDEALDNSIESLTANPNAALDNSVESLTANPDSALDNSVESLSATSDATLVNSVESLTASHNETLECSTANPDQKLDNSVESLTANLNETLESSTANLKEALDNSAESSTAHPDAALDKSAESLTANLNETLESSTANPGVALDNSAESSTAQPDAALDKSAESLTANPDETFDNSGRVDEEKLAKDPVAPEDNQRVDPEVTVAKSAPMETTEGASSEALDIVAQTWTGADSYQYKPVNGDDVTNTAKADETVERPSTTANPQIKPCEETHSKPVASSSGSICNPANPVEVMSPVLDPNFPVFLLNLAEIAAEQSYQVCNDRKNSDREAESSDSDRLIISTSEPAVPARRSRTVTRHKTKAELKQEMRPIAEETDADDDLPLAFRFETIAGKSQNRRRSNVGKSPPKSPARKRETNVAAKLRKSSAKAVGKEEVDTVYTSKLRSRSSRTSKDEDVTPLPVSALPTPEKKDEEKVARPRGRPRKKSTIKRVLETPDEARPTRQPVDFFCHQPQEEKKQPQLSKVLNRLKENLKISEQKEEEKKRKATKRPSSGSVHHVTAETSNSSEIRRENCKSEKIQKALPLQSEISSKVEESVSKPSSVACVTPSQTSTLSDQDVVTKVELTLSEPVQSSDLMEHREHCVEDASLVPGLVEETVATAKAPVGVDDLSEETSATVTKCVEISEPAEQKESEILPVAKSEDSSAQALLVLDASDPAPEKTAVNSPETVEKSAPTHSIDAAMSYACVDNDLINFVSEYEIESIASADEEDLLLSEQEDGGRLQKSLQNKDTMQSLVEQSAIEPKQDNNAAVLTHNEPSPAVEDSGAAGINPEGTELLAMEEAKAEDDRATVSIDVEPESTGQSAPEEHPTAEETPLEAKTVEQTDCVLLANPIEAFQELGEEPKQAPVQLETPLEEQPKAVEIAEDLGKVQLHSAFSEDAATTAEVPKSVVVAEVPSIQLEIQCEDFVPIPNVQATEDHQPKDQELAEEPKEVEIDTHKGVFVIGESIPIEESLSVETMPMEIAVQLSVSNEEEVINSSIEPAALQEVVKEDPARSEDKGCAKVTVTEDILFIANEAFHVKFIDHTLSDCESNPIDVVEERGPEDKVEDLLDCPRLNDGELKMYFHKQTPEDHCPGGSLAAVDIALEMANCVNASSISFIEAPINAEESAPEAKVDEAWPSACYETVAEVIVGFQESLDVSGLEPLREIKEDCFDSNRQSNKRKSPTEWLSEAQHAKRAKQESGAADKQQQDKEEERSRTAGGCVQERFWQDVMTSVVDELGWRSKQRSPSRPSRKLEPPTTPTVPELSRYGSSQPQRTITLKAKQPRKDLFLLDDIPIDKSKVDKYLNEEFLRSECKPPAVNQVLNSTFNHAFHSFQEPSCFGSGPLRSGLIQVRDQVSSYNKSSILDCLARDIAEESEPKRCRVLKANPAIARKPNPRKPNPRQRDKEQEAEELSKFLTRTRHRGRLQTPIRKGNQNAAAASKTVVPPSKKPREDQAKVESPKREPAPQAVSIIKLPKEEKKGTAVAPISQMPPIKKPRLPVESPKREPALKAVSAIKPPQEEKKNTSVAPKRQMPPIKKPRLPVESPKRNPAPKAVSAIKPPQEEKKAFAGAILKEQRIKTEPENCISFDHFSFNMESGLSVADPDTKSNSSFAKSGVQDLEQVFEAFTDPAIASRLVSIQQPSPLDTSGVKQECAPIEPCANGTALETQERDSWIGGKGPTEPILVDCPGWQSFTERLVSMDEPGLLDTDAIKQECVVPLEPSPTAYNGQFKETVLETHNFTSIDERDSWNSSISTTNLDDFSGWPPLDMLYFSNATMNELLAHVMETETQPSLDCDDSPSRQLNGSASRIRTMSTELQEDVKRVLFPDPPYQSRQGQVAAAVGPAVKPSRASPPKPQDSSKRKRSTNKEQDDRKRQRSRNTLQTKLPDPEPAEVTPEIKRESSRQAARELEQVLKRSLIESSVKKDRTKRFDKARARPTNNGHLKANSGGLSSMMFSNGDRPKRAHVYAPILKPTPLEAKKAEDRRFDEAKKLPTNPFFKAKSSLSNSGRTVVFKGDHYDLDTSNGGSNFPYD